MTELSKAKALLTNERLIEMLSQVHGLEPGRVRMSDADIMDLRRALIELLSLRQSHSTGSVAWTGQCPDCGCRNKADIENADGSPDGRVRCIECKRLFGAPNTPKEAEVTVTEEMVELGMNAFIEEVRRQDGEWTDDFDEERLLTSPSGDWFAPFFPIRAALVAALSRKG